MNKRKLYFLNFLLLFLYFFYQELKPLISPEKIAFLTLILLDFKNIIRYLNI